MEDLLRRVYRGDPGVPHTDPNHYSQAWLGCFVVAAVSCCTSCVSDLTKRFNWDDKAMMLEQKYWKKAMEKKHKNSKS